MARKEKQLTHARAHARTHTEIIFRKSDVRKKGKTRGWEMMLSHSFGTGVTSGYVKGTASSDVGEALEQLKACRAEAGHPLLLPVVVLAHDLAETSDIRQRSARDWLRRLENAITMRDEIDRSEVYTDFDVDGINRDLVECHSQVLWKRPQAYQEIVREFARAMDRYQERAFPADGNGNGNGNGNGSGEWDGDGDGGWDGGRSRRPGRQPARPTARPSRPPVRRLHASILARLDFYRAKLAGMEHYAHTTLERLHIQRQAVSCFCFPPRFYSGLLFSVGCLSSRIILFLAVRLLFFYMVTGECVRERERERGGWGEAALWYLRGIAYIDGDSSCAGVTQDSLALAEGISKDQACTST